MFKKRRKGYLVMQRGIGITPFPLITWPMAPVKAVEYAKSKGEAEKDGGKENESKI